MVKTEMICANWLEGTSYASLNLRQERGNNPVRYIDPDGRDYYYTQDGVYLGQDDKKTQYVYAVNNDSYYSGKDGKSIVIESGMTQIMDNQGNAMLHNDFQEIAGTIYKEMDAVKYTWEEGAAIYSVLENRGKENNTTVLEEAKVRGAAYGHKEWKEIKDPLASKDKVQNAYKGTIRGALDSYDYSGGAYSWQGRDLGIKNSGAYNWYYLSGLDFTSDSHNIWGLTKTEGPYKYETTAVFGKTTFLNLTNDWKTKNRYTKKW